MKGPLIIALLAVYVLFVLARFGGHYVHILAVAAMAVYLYGLFTAKSAGVSNDIDSSSSYFGDTSHPPADAPLKPLTQADPNRSLPESD
jgi:hypothetical protein